MQENATQVKGTPNRRRNVRYPGKASAQKMYASENDVAVPSAAFSGQSPKPLTPLKSTSASPEPQSTGGQLNSSRPTRTRSNNHSNGAGSGGGGGNTQRTRVKHAAASPDSGHAARRTPPNSVPTTRSVGVTAFAGSTFHASPAPSALPIPSFFAKTSTDSPDPRALNDATQQQPSPPITDTELPTPQRGPFPPVRESPLEAIFRADRVEKENARRTSFATPAATRYGLASPVQYSPRESQTVPQQYNGSPRERFQTQRSSSGIPLSELDGTPGGPVGPAFSRPYHERIRAAHSSPQSPYGTQEPGSLTREDPSEALKKVLFGPRLNKTEAPPPIPSEPVARSNLPEGRPPGVLAMEDDLRRILKLS